MRKSFEEEEEYREIEDENSPKNSIAAYIRYGRRQDLIAAIDEDDVEAVRRILKAKPKLLFKTSDYGETPLLHAVFTRGRSAECVRLLIEAGADVNAKTTEGYTALHHIVNLSCGKTALADEETAKIARLLVDAGAELEGWQHYGYTPLMYAVMEGTTAEVRILLSVGADPNKIFPQHAMPCFTRGRSILSMAMTNREVMQLLLEAGADVDARDHYGQTAVEYAQHLIQDGSSEDFEQKLLAGIELIRSGSAISSTHPPNPNPPSIAPNSTAR